MSDADCQSGWLGKEIDLILYKNIGGSICFTMVHMNHYICNLFTILLSLEFVYQLLKFTENYNIPS